MPSSPPIDLAERSLELARVYRAQRAHVWQQLRGFGVRDGAIEDALHDVFVIAFRRIGSYDTQRGSLRAWLVGIAWRVAAAHRRRREVGEVLHDDEVAGDLPDPEAYAARSEAAVVLDALLRSLPPEQAAAFVLAELEGLSGAEIAEQWSIAPATAYTRVARARLKMQAELERHRYGRRPWWAVVFWPGGAPSRGHAIAAAFVSMRVLAGIVSAIVLLGGVVWWLGDRGPAPVTAVADTIDARPDPRAPTRPTQSTRDDEPVFGPRGKAASIAGVVRAIAGAPIDGAEICAWPEITEHATPTPTCTKSTSSGVYRIAGVLPSRYRITASARGFAPGEAASSNARGTGSIALHAGEQREGVDVVLSPGGVELRGRVNDVFGGVVDGARISVTQHSIFTRIDGPNSGPGVPVHAATATDGTFVVWVGEGELDVVAKAEGYGDTRTRVRAPGPTVTIAMLPESTLSGVVVRRDTKAPVAGARVVLRSWSETTTHEETAAFTDDVGRFELRGLVPGRYRPAAYADGLQGESTNSHVLELGESKDGVVVEMVAAATLHARVVVAPDDTPCPSGSVMLWDHRAEILRTAPIGPGGAVQFPALVPGEYGLVVGCDDHDGSKLPTSIVVADADDREVVWRVERGLAIRGHVHDANGEPVAGQVMATAASAGLDGAPRWGIVAADGTYVLQGLAPGDYSLMVDCDGPDLEARTTIVDRDVVVDFDAPATVRLTGKATRGAEPAAGVAVVATSNTGWSEPEVFAADDGTFTFAALAPGRYRVRGEDELGNTSAEQIVELTASREPAPLQLAMPEARTIQGIVLDEDGGPLRDALISARATSTMTTDASRRAELRAAKAGGPGTTLSDAHGEFVLTGIAKDQTYTVVAQRRGGGSAAQEGVSAGQRARLQLAATATVRGSVRAATTPSALWIEMYTGGGLVHREAFVTGSGTFEIDDVDPGEYELRVIAREGRSKAKVVATSGKTTVVDLELAPNRALRGRFVDLETKEPLAGLWALTTERGVSSQRIAIVAERAIQARTPGLLTGADGIFHARDVPPTAVTLLVMSQGFRYEAVEDVMEAITVPQSHPDEITDFVIAKQRISWVAAPGDLGFELRQVPLACDETPTVAKIVDSTIAAGLVEGDEIVSVDGHDVTELRCYLVRALLRVPPETTVTLGLARGETVRVTAKPPK